MEVEYHLIKINLKSLLKQRGMTMTQLHEKTGITQNALSLFANSKSNGVQYTTLEKIVKALDCSMDDLFSIVNATFDVYVELVSVKGNIKENTFTFTFALIGVNERGEKSKVTYGFEVIKNVSKKGRTIVYISYLGREKVELEFLNDEIFTDSIMDYSGKALSQDLLLVYSYLITEKILLRLNDATIDLTSLVIFSWNGLVKLKNEEIIKINLISKGDDQSPIKNAECEVAPNIETLSSNDNIIEINMSDNSSSIKMYL